MFKLKEKEKNKKDEITNEKLFKNDKVNIETPKTNKKDEKKYKSDIK